MDGIQKIMREGCLRGSGYHSKIVQAIGFILLVDEEQVFRCRRLRESIQI